MTFELVLVVAVLLAVGYGVYRLVNSDSHEVSEPTVTPVVDTAPAVESPVSSTVTAVADDAEVVAKPVKKAKAAKTVTKKAKKPKLKVAK